MQHWKKGTYISFMAFIVPVDRKKQWLGQPGCSLSGSGFPPACPERPHKWENGWTFSLAEQRSHEDSSVITCHWCWTLPGSNWRETLPAALLGALLNWDQVQFNLVYAKEMLNENYSWSYRKYDLSISNLSSTIWGFILILFSLLRWIQPSLLCTLRHNRTCHTRPPPQEAWPCWIYSMSSRTPASLCLFGPLTCSRKDLALLLIKVLCVNPCHLTTVSLSPASDRVYKVWFWFHHGNVITWIQCA